MLDNTAPKSRLEAWLKTVQIDQTEDESAALLRVATALSSRPPATLIDFLISRSFELDGDVTAGQSQYVQVCVAEPSVAEIAKRPEVTRVLCGAALASLFERDDDDAIVASLKVKTTSFNGARAAPPPIDLVGLANFALVRNSEKSRKRPVFAIPEKPVFGTATATKDIPPNSGVNVDQLKVFGANIEAGFTSIQTQIKRVTTKTEAFLDIVYEEVDMLWWLIDQNDRIAGRTFAGIQPQVKPITFPKQLADMTVAKPGPRSLRALLSRAGVSSEALTVSEAVNACEVDWLKEIVANTDCDRLTQPVLRAMQERIRTNSETAWKDYWESITKLSSSRSIPAIDLAEQVYQELLLAGEA